MAAEIIFGAPGSGKTEDIYRELIESSSLHPDIKHIVITPEQNTLLTEKRLLGLNPKHILFNIDVLSFNRLSYLIFEKAGIGNPEIIGETGKSMLLRRIVAENKDELSYYSSSLHKAGFIHKLKVMISELLMYGVTPSDIRDCIITDEVSSRDSLKSKLQDLCNILEHFNAARDEKHLTSEELLPKALGYIGESNIFDNSYVVFDGFTGFTKIQYDFIKCINSKCSKIIFSFDIPSSENVLGTYEKHELFYPIKDTINKLQDAFSEIGTKIEIQKHNDESRVVRDASLSHLSKNFLREDVSVYNLPSFDDPGKAPISLWSCLNPVKEAEFISHEIIKLVKNEGLNYRDIAVVTGNLEDTAPALKEAFAKEGIPVYIDTKDSISHNPLCVFVLSLIEVVEKSFKTDVVLRNIKSGLSCASSDELDILENYVIAHGINGFNKWSNPFTINSYRNHENLDLDAINCTRGKIVAPLLKFKKEFQAAKTISAAINSVKNVFELCDIKTKLENYSSDLYEDGDIVTSGTYNQIYDVINNIFDELNTILGNEPRPSAKEFREIIKSGIEEYSVGVLPPSIDEIHIGDVRRSRRGHVKAMFFASFNDGVIPSPLAAGGILNDIDRETLSNLNINLAPSSKQTSFDEQYLIYQILSAPTFRLYISFDRLNLANESLNPSSYLGYIKTMFNNLNINNYNGYSYEEISNSYEAILYLANNLNKPGKEDQTELLATIYNSIDNENDREKVSGIIKAAFFNYQGETLSKEVNDKIYGSDINGSVSMLELQASCSYRRFLKHVLSLKERVELQFSPFDMGNFYHKVLEETFNNIISSKIDYKDITDDTFDTLISSAIESSISEIKSFDIFETGKGEYFLGRWKKIIRSTTKSMITNLCESPYKPFYAEKQFDNNSAPSLDVSLDNGYSFKMSGKIDRVDIFNDNDVMNFKIVDYKSSEKKIDKHLVDGGIQLQLITYLNAMEEVLQNEFPRNKISKEGVSYFTVGQRYVEAKTLDEDVSEKLLKAYNYISKEDELDELSDLVAKKNLEISNSIARGEISKNPYVYNKETSCDNCEYKDMCDFDPRLNGFIRRNIAYKDPEERGEKDGV